MSENSIINTPASSPPAADPIPLLIPDVQAAALAGVSRAHWQRLRSAGKLPPSIKLGRKVLWRRLEIEEWIAAGCPDAKVWGAMQAAAGRRLKVS
jgi:predicted DNA-binding transcriptional regulator AlpA